MNDTLATITVLAGTALVLTPVDPTHINTRRPAQTTPGFTALLLAHADTTLAADVRSALGMRGRRVNEASGETARRVGVWSQHELNEVYERVGGVVATRTVQRTYSGGTVTAAEITVTATLPGIGVVEIVTDWDEESGGHDLPVMRNLAA
ncbi:hypothetical protein [Streptomyces bacillaris]|uniref:hypothetical protein n=1 Tax=Streptomyces bacillaris TaxID=68179 RepID=UPI003D71FD12